MTRKSNQKTDLATATDLAGALLRISTIIATRANQATKMTEITGVVKDLLGAEACLSFSYDAKASRFYFGPSSGLSKTARATIEDKPDQFYELKDAGKLFHTGKPILIDGLNEDQSGSMAELLKLHGKLAVQSALILPLRTRDRLVGALHLLYLKQQHRFNEAEIAIAEALAAHLAIALENAELQAKIESHRRELIGLSRKVVEAQEEERRRISRELHDEAGQALTAIKINLEMVERELGPRSERVRLRLQEAKELVDLTLNEVRRLSHELRPSILDDLGLMAALRWYTGSFSQRTGIKVQLGPEELPERLPPTLETTLYRVVQEALTNVIKHAGARNVSIDLDCDARHCRLVVLDDGKGFTEPDRSTKGIGLLGMAERVRLFDGLVTLESLKKGARLVVDIPFDSTSVAQPN